MDVRERDGLLVGRTIGGDRDAYGELCRIYYEALRRYVGSRLVYADMVDDVVQTSFLRVHQILPEHEADTPFWPFLQQVARRVVYEELRAAKRFPARESDPVLELMAERNASLMEQGVDDALDRSLAALEQCLMKLSARIQDMLRRVYGGCARVKDLAVELGMNPNALAARLYRWRIQLTHCVRQRLREDNP